MYGIHSEGQTEGKGILILRYYKIFYTHAIMKSSCLRYEIFLFDPPSAAEGKKISYRRQIKEEDFKARAMKSLISYYAAMIHSVV